MCLELHSAEHTLRWPPAPFFVGSGTNALTNHENSGSETTEGCMYLKPLGYKFSWMYSGVLLGGEEGREDGLVHAEGTG